MCGVCAGVCVCVCGVCAGTRACVCVQPNVNVRVEVSWILRLKRTKSDANKTLSQRDGRSGLVVDLMQTAYVPVPLWCLLLVFVFCGRTERRPVSF